MAKSKLEEALEKYLTGNLELRAGIFETAKYPEGEQVAEVAYKQEFGSPSENIPSRPFFRHAIAVNQKNLSAVIANGFRHYDGDIELAMRAAGEVIVDDLRNSVINWSTPPNAQYTVDLKGFNNPLVDTGQLANSFGYEVIDDQG
ncbi:hypothetical protein V6858_003974 [Providencia rettgeri]